jgi:hypothetical protein
MVAVVASKEHAQQRRGESKGRDGMKHFQLKFKTQDEVIAHIIHNFKPLCLLALRRTGEITLLNKSKIIVFLYCPKLPMFFRKESISLTSVPILYR